MLKLNYAIVLHINRSALADGDAVLGYIGVGYVNGNGINDDGHAVLITGHDDKTGDYEYWNPEDAAYHTTDGSNFIGGWQLDNAK